MNHTSAIIIPLHLKHLNYFFRFFKSKLVNEIKNKIYLVLTYNTDLKQLLEYTEKFPELEYVVMEEIVPKNIIKMSIENKSIVSYKKFVALNHLKEKHEYFYVFDSEVEFIKKCDMDQIAIDYYKDLKIYSNKLYQDHPKITKIIREPYKFFNINEKKKIIENIKHSYFWFNDIPLYKSEYLNGFFEKIDFIHRLKFIRKMNWFVFEYILYIYYLITIDKVKIINIDSEYNIKMNNCFGEQKLNDNNREQLKKIFEITKPMWSLKSIPNNYSDNIFIHFHLDR